MASLFGVNLPTAGCWRAQESLLCRDVCFRSLPVSARRSVPQGEVRKRMQAVADARLAGPFARASRRIHHGGRISEKQRTLGKKPHQWRRDNTGRASARRFGSITRAVVVRYCGRALTVSYRGNGGIYPTYLCNWLASPKALATKDCLSFRCDLLDRRRCWRNWLKALAACRIGARTRPVCENWKTRDQAIMRPVADAPGTCRIRSRARRASVQEVDPSQRLVAGTSGTSLERCAPSGCRTSRSKPRKFQLQEARVATPEQKEKVLALARDSAAGMACSHHPGQGPQANVAAAHQGHHR